MSTLPKAMSRFAPGDDGHGEIRRDAVMECLRAVNDPELDESVVEMGFVHGVAINGDDIDIAFRLPTFWCAANFAFLMAEDMRIAAQGLPWAGRVRVRLEDHFAADKINRGIEEGASFEAVFADEANEGLGAVRRTFRHKAYLGRQETLLSTLAGTMPAHRMLALTVADLERLARDREPEIAVSARRYLAARRHDGGPAGPADPAITTLDGDAVGQADFADHRRRSRRTLGAARANAEMCRMYLKARYDPKTSIETLDTHYRRDMP